MVRNLGKKWVSLKLKQAPQMGPCLGLITYVIASLYSRPRRKRGDPPPIVLWALKG